MRATGIVRRIDDLGRVVIPKEIRRMMRIREGDPLEIYTNNGMVCFQRYNPINEESWKKADQIVISLLNKGCALLDRYEEIICVGGIPKLSLQDYKAQGFIVKEVKVEGETECYIIAEKGQDEMLNHTVKILQILFAEDF